MLRRDPVSKDKLQQPYLSPYTVKKKVSPVSYQLDNSGGKDRTVHANDLKLWKVPTASALTIAAVELEDDDEIVLPNETGTLPTVSKARTSAEKKEAEQIIIYNVELFKGKAGRTQSATHSIHTTADKRLKRPPIYRIPVYFLDPARKHIRELLDQELIESSTSSWTSPIICVKKPDRSIRVCGDYHRLNDIMTPDPYSLRHGKSTRPISKKYSTS